MLLKSFERVDELQKENKLLVNDFKLMAADAHQLPFGDDSFDTVVSTFGLESTYDLDLVLREMKRVCKNHGRILVISRGLSYVSLYNEWLKFKAARDLTHFGRVEHLNMEKILENPDKHPELTVYHKERKNMGMTYIYILDVDKDPKPPREEEDLKKPEEV
jgi:ubiquinone/menaquinone biosynthesis C-methylase UbiE